MYTANLGVYLSKAGRKYSVKCKCKLNLWHSFLERIACVYRRSQSDWERNDSHAAHLEVKNSEVSEGSGTKLIISFLVNTNLGFRNGMVMNWRNIIVIFVL